MKRKITWTSLIVLVLSITVYILFIRVPRKTVVSSQDVVMRETLTRKISATGTINPVHMVEVGTQVSGTIDKLFVDFNDRVTSSEIIAKMDTRNLIAIVRESENSLSKAEVQLNQISRTLKRNREFYKGNGISQAEMENTEDEYNLALMAYNTAKLQLERNKVNLGYATIRSPIDGIVISRKVDEGQTVAASFTTPAIYVIANDMREMKIEASVDEADIGQVTSGQTVEFTVDAYPDEIFHGIVRQIQLLPVTVQNVVTYTVEITIDNAELKLMPGMTATLDIIVERRKDVLTVPNGVFSLEIGDDLAEQLRDNGYLITFADTVVENTVWKKTNRNFIQIPVKAGYSNGIKTEISGLITEGDTIVNYIEITERQIDKSRRSFMMPQSPENDKENQNGEENRSNK